MGVGTDGGGLGSKGRRAYELDTVGDVRVRLKVRLRWGGGRSMDENWDEDNAKVLQIKSDQLWASCKLVFS